LISQEGSHLKVVLEGYIPGVFNELNPKRMEDAFPKDFATSRATVLRFLDF